MDTCVGMLFSELASTRSQDKLPISYRLMRRACAGFTLEILEDFIQMDASKLLIEKRTLLNFSMENMFLLERCVYDFTL